MCFYQSSYNNNSITALITLFTVCILASCQDTSVAPEKGALNSSGQSIYNLTGVSVGDEILSFQDRATFKRVFDEMIELYEKDSVYFDFNDTTLSDDSIPFFPTLDIFDQDMNHISLRSLIEEEIWAVVTDPGRNILDDFPDTGYIADPFMQNIFNRYHEFKIDDTIFKSLNPCTVIEIVGSDGLATSIRSSGLSPSTEDLNHPEITIKNVDWGCGDCRVSFYRNIVSSSSQGTVVQFVPHKLDSTADTVLTGYDISWRFNDTIKSNAKYPTLTLPTEGDLNVSLVVKKDDCYYGTGGTYKRRNCSAEFKLTEGVFAAGSYEVWVEDNGSEHSFFGYPILNWEYDFDDGEIKTANVETHQVSKTYTSGGTYNVKLTITDSDLCTDETIKKIDIGDIKNCCKTTGKGDDGLAFDLSSTIPQKIYLASGWVNDMDAIQTLGSNVRYFEYSNFWADHVPKRAKILQTGLYGQVYSPKCASSELFDLSKEKKNRSILVQTHTRIYGYRYRIQTNTLSGLWYGEDSSSDDNSGGYYINPFCL